MARRDVDLVVRARDEAAGVIDQITKALREFGEGQRDLAPKADRTESALGKLGAAFGRLQQQVGTTDIGQRLTESFERAQTSAQKLEGSLRELQAEQARLSTRTRATGDQVERYAAKLERTKAAQDRQTQSLREAQGEQRRLAAEYERLKTAQTALAASYERIPQALARQSAAVQTATARLEGLKAKLAATEAPSKRLVASVQSATNALTSAQERLARTEAQYQSLSEAIGRNNVAVDSTRQSLTAASASLARQEAILARTSQNYQRLRASLQTWQGAQRQVAQELARTNGQLQQQQGQLARTAAEMEKLGAASAEAQAKVQQLADQGARALRREFLGTVQTLQQTRAAYLGMTDVVSQMAAEIGRVGVPTRQMIQNFEQAKVSAAQAKQEFREQQIMVQRLRTAYAEMGAGLAGVQATQQRFAAVQARTRQAMQATADAAQRKRAAISASLGVTQQAAAANQRLASSAREVAAAKNQAATAATRAASAFNQLYGGSRQSLSLLQRIRGEVLALTASYVGLFAAFQGLGTVANNLQVLEGAQSRLNVIFDGDQQLAAQELDFIRRNADRLGISMATLADQYTKFAVATRGTRLEGQATRDIFISLAEAARVNRASSVQLERAFLALEQMASKGVISMEELRQQLGDSLPGAFNMMAEAAARAGLITDRFATDELAKLIENGQLSSDILVEFAQVLDDRFGGQLPAALDTLAAAFGRFQNALFQATLVIGQGAFQESLINLLNTLSTVLQSPEAITFFERLGTAIAAVIDIVRFAVENFRVLFAVMAGLVAIKLTPVIVALTAALGAKLALLPGLVAGMAAWRAGMVATVASAGAATAAATGLSGALAAALRLLSPGFAIPAIAVGIALWATRANEATAAMVSHRQAVDQVRSAYENAGGSVQEFRDRVADVTVTQLQENLENLESTIRNTVGRLATEASGITRAFGGVFSGLIDSAAYQQAQTTVQALIQQFRDGEITARELRDGITEVGLSLDRSEQSAIAYIRSVEAIVRELVEQTDAAEEARLAIIAKTGSEEQARSALDQLTGAQNRNTRELVSGEEAARRYRSALDEIRGVIPSLQQELTTLDQRGRLIEATRGALTYARTLGQVVGALRLAGQALRELNAIDVGTLVAPLGDVTGTANSVQAAANLLRRDEGFISTPAWDVNALRVGFGSDTITLADGTIQRVTAGMRVSVEDANRDLLRRITTEFMPRARSAVGDETWRNLNAQQQAVLTSIAYNYGSVPGRLAGPIRSGASDQEIARIIRDVLGADNGGVRRNRYNRNAALWLTDAGQDAAIRQANQREAEQRRAEEERLRRETSARQSIEARIADQRFEASLRGQPTADAEVARAIRQAEEEAARGGIELTAEQRAEIEALTRARVEEQAAARAGAGASRESASARSEENTELEAAREAQEQVNQLQAQQAAMRRELELVTESGDTERAAELRSELEGVNTALVAAIDNAIRLWEAVGGQQSATAIAQLRAARAEAQGLSQEARQNEFDWKRVGDLFVNGLVNAFQRFAQAVAQGKSVGEAAREAFLQFAAEFLIEIGKMIVQQMILNALRGAFGGTQFGAMLGFGHTGGIVGSKRVGSGNMARRVDPGVFAGAARFHTGGIVGLRPNEVPIIAKKGEEVLTEDDPRHMWNQSGGSGGGDSRSMKIVNAFDGSDMLNEALGSAAGEEVFVNYVRRNRTRVRSALGI